MIPGPQRADLGLQPSLGHYLDERAQVVAVTLRGLGVVALDDRGARGFAEQRRVVDGISQKMRSQTLRGLERDGLVFRRIYVSVHPR